MNRLTVGFFGVVAVALLLFGIFVWPTPYRYETVALSYRLGGRDITRSMAVVFRINRYTGSCVPVVSSLASFRGVVDVEYEKEKPTEAKEEMNNGKSN